MLRALAVAAVLAAGVFVAFGSDIVTLEQAREAAAGSGRLILVDGSADW
ncbi:MAG: hypothetical protein KBD01_12910 [Acidobacteria bacterium]|nr:hypothetical protein [Acidobacteriota bacterium]